MKQTKKFYELEKGNRFYLNGVEYMAIGTVTRLGGNKTYNAVTLSGQSEGELIWNDYSADVDVQEN